MEYKPNEGVQPGQFKKNAVPSKYEVIEKPSNVIKYHHTTVDLNGTTCSLALVTMKRSFLLVINNIKPGELRLIEGEDGLMRPDEIISCFMDSNPSLRGLSLAIGEHSTCLIDSENSLASVTLATRLSKKLNMNRPVYVANNLEMSHDTIDFGGVLSNMYVKIFQFVRANYKLEDGLSQ